MVYTCYELMARVAFRKYILFWVIVKGKIRVCDIDCDTP